MRAVAPPTPCFLTNYVFCHLRGAFCLHRVRPAMRRGLWRWPQAHSLFWSARFLIRDVVPVPQKHLGLHEMIAKSFCCWLYSRLPTMKARSYIVRALLFALVLVPSALQTSARPLGAPSCHVGKQQLRGEPCRQAGGPGSARGFHAGPSCTGAAAAPDSRQKDQHFGGADIDAPKLHTGAFSQLRCAPWPAGYGRPQSVPRTTFAVLPLKQATVS